MSDNDLSDIKEGPLTPEQSIWRLKILFTTYFAYIGFYLTRKVFGICKTTLSEEYDISYGQLANIWTLFLVGYMVGQFVNSFIGRKWGPRVLMLGGLGISICFNVVFGFANSYATFLVFMLFNGLVQAAGWPGVVGGVAEWVRSKERGSIMGIWATNYVLGNALVKMLGGYLLAYYSAEYDGKFGVRYAFLGSTLLASTIWWLIFFWQRNKPEDVGLKPIVDHEHVAGRAVKATSEEHIGFSEYVKLLYNPIIPLMGLSYFSIKYLRYSLDSWLPTFLDLKGMGKGEAAYYSSIFDWAGFVGAIAAGFALDRLFRGHWERLCVVLGVGLIGGYLAVIQYGENPVFLAFCFGLVGFMLYGPDTLLSGAASVAVAGQRNAVAIAGLVNGIGSIGPVVQEQINGYILDNNSTEDAVRVFNYLGLSLSVCFVASMIYITWRVGRARTDAADHAAEQKNKQDDAS